jgi:GAF domain-containing protein
MVLGWRVRRAFTLEDTPLAEAIGRIAGIVIENCHLYEESRQQASETRKLLEVAMRISSHLDRQKLLEAIAREASLLLDIPQVSIFLYDAERDELLGQAVHGQVPVAIQEMRVPLSFSQTATEAIRSGIPVVVEDTATDARVPRELVERVGIKASLVIPLGRNSRPCGLLFLDELHGPRQFTQHELEVGRSFADQVAMALENSRLFEERERRLQELSTILETARSVSSTLILRDLLQVVVQRLQGLLKCDTYCLYLADAAGKCLNPVIAEGPHAEQVLTRKIPWGESFTGDVIARGRGEILNDAHLSGRSRRIPGTPLEPESLLCVPLMSRGQVFGGLRLGKFGEGNHFHPHDLEVCEILAGHVGSGVDNAWLHEETVRRLDELSVLHQVASAGATILDLETLLEKTTDVVARVLGYEHFAVLLLDESSEHLRLVAGRGFPSELEGMFTIPLGNGITGVCALKGEAQLVLDVAQDSRYIQATPGTKSEMCAPLRVGERVIGVLNVESARPAAFSDVDLRLLQTLAGEVGLMIERSRLFEQVQRRAEEMESVYRIGAAATSSLSLQDVLKVAYEQISRLMDVSTFYIALYDQATDELRFVIDVDKGVFSPESRRILSERPGLTGWVIHSRKPLLLSNVATERPQLPVEAIVIGEEPESWLGVPLLHQNRLIGVMSVQSYEKNAFDLNHQRLLESVATQVAAAIEHARLFEELNGAYEELKRTQAQLVQAEKMSAVGQLAAGVAHELNNPLGGILEYAQFMLEKARVKGLERMGESDLQNWLRYTGRIERESQRCKEIVQSLLRFSRASGEDFGPVQINDVLDDTLLFTQHQLSLANVEVIRELSTDLPFIQGSSNQLQQVFTNLIVNAKLAMPDGGKLILRTSLGPDPGQVRVDIEDTGCGIAEENLPRIFDPFFTTRTVGEGTGLGLYVSYRIVRDHQGMIEVQSERGRGTTFALSFPAGA